MNLLTKIITVNNPVRHILFITLSGKEIDSMTDEEENQNEVTESKPFSGRNLNRILAILFVLAIYVIIFLKILFLD